MSKETRVLTDRHEIRAVEDDGMKLVGYGAVFESLSSDLGGFREKINPAAFNRSLASGHDVLITFNHDVNHLLGRTSSRSASVSVDEVGLKYEVSLPDTQTGRDTWELARRGDLAGSSFTFSIAKNGDSWERSDTGDRVRTLNDVTLYELGPVVTPAYLDTTVAARSLADLVSTEETESEDEDNSGEDDSGDGRATTVSAERRRLRTVR